MESDYTKEQLVEWELDLVKANYFKKLYSGNCKAPNFFLDVFDSMENLVSRNYSNFEISFERYHENLEKSSGSFSLASIHQAKEKLLIFGELEEKVTDILNFFFDEISGNPSSIKQEYDKQVEKSKYLSENSN